MKTKAKKTESNIFRNQISEPELIWEPNFGSRIEFDSVLVFDLKFSALSEKPNRNIHIFNFFVELIFFLVSGH